MSVRHKAREIALQFLYKNDQLILEKAFRPHDLAHDLEAHFKHFAVPEDSREFAGQLVAGTLMEIAKLDSLIEQQASNWKLQRMSAVDRSILRMAVYELTHFRETAPSIVINEAVELGKQFGTEDSPSFVNGILDAIKGRVLNP